MARARTRPFCKEASFHLRYFCERERWKPKRLAERIGMDRTQFHRIVNLHDYGHRLNEAWVPALAGACRLTPGETQALYDALKRDRERAANHYTPPPSPNELDCPVVHENVGAEVMAALRHIHWVYEVSSGEPLSHELLYQQMLAEEIVSRFARNLGYPHISMHWNSRALDTASKLNDRPYLMLFNHRKAMNFASDFYLYQTALDHLETVAHAYQDVISTRHFSAIYRDMAEITHKGLIRGQAPRGESPLTYLNWADNMARDADRPDELDHNRLKRSEYLLSYGKPDKTLKLLDEYDISASAGDDYGKVYIMFYELRIRAEAGETKSIAQSRLDEIEKMARNLDFRVLLTDLQGFRQKFG